MKFFIKTVIEKFSMVLFDAVFFWNFLINFRFRDWYLTIFNGLSLVKLLAWKYWFNTDLDG